MLSKAPFQLSLWEGVMVVIGFSAVNYIAVLDSRSGRKAVERGERLSETDPRLIDRIRHQLRPPSDGPINLENPEKSDWSQHGNPDFISALTGNKIGGFFIECGAFNGEDMSTTLKLERHFGWSGLLMEPARQLYAKLVKKKRHAWLLEACISGQSYAYTAQFEELDFMGDVKDVRTAKVWSDVLKRYNGTFFGRNMSARQEYEVACYPLAAVLAALGSPSVDFFSLDIEGLEMSVIASIPWRQLDIKMVAVEVFMGSMFNPQTAGIIDFMEQNGYLAEPLFIDWLFIKKDSDYAKGAVQTIRHIRNLKAPKLEKNATEGIPHYSKWYDGKPEEYKMRL